MRVELIPNHEPAVLTHQNGKPAEPSLKSESESDLENEARAPLEPIQFMTDEEQGDDPESIQRWIDETNATPSPVMTPEQEANMIAWRAQMREYNIEAVRKQMEQGIW